MRVVVLIIACFFSMQVTAQKTDHRLTKQIQELIQGFRGETGVYVHDLEKNKVVAINADSVFPTASMVKIPILVGVMDQISKGQLKYHQKLTYKDSLLYAGEDILGSFKSGEQIELSKVMMLMLTTSDNTASLWLQSLGGTGTHINALMDSLGLQQTRVNSRTPGREANRNQYGWGQTTPAEMAKLMEMIVNKKVISAAASEQMLRLLGRNYWDEEALSQIPAGVFVASKNGAVNASRSEVLYVNGDDARYIFCICTKNNQDQSWGPNNEAWVLTKKLSALLWKYYN
ncbi:MAG TPA: serine hydrolase [Chitinophagaceae bacterium]|nr:serine hydrolase [Chitinophagaceae bacterium]